MRKVSAISLVLSLALLLGAWACSTVEFAASVAVAQSGADYILAVENAPATTTTKVNNLFAQVNNGYTAYRQGTSTASSLQSLIAETSSQLSQIFADLNITNQTDKNLVILTVDEVSALSTLIPAITGQNVQPATVKAAVTHQQFKAAFNKVAGQKILK